MIFYSELGFARRWGRLGNQMFEYAGLKGIAAYKGYDWVIPTKEAIDEYIDPKNGKDTGPYDLLLAFDLKTYSTLEPHVIKPNRIATPNLNLFPQWGNKISEQTAESLLKQTRDGIDYSGNYFQSELWFKHIKDEIKKDFTFRPEILNKVNIKDFSEYAFIHVRRGDYVNNNGYVDLSLNNYYEMAMSQFDFCQKFLVISDDIEYCKTLSYFKDCEFSDWGNNGIEDLATMSLCNGGINANSSYSWWGAYLQKDRTNPIIYPNINTNWHGPRKDKKDLDGLMPKEWTQI